jgi:hypothetical protein
MLFVRKLLGRSAQTSLCEPLGCAVQFVRAETPLWGYPYPHNRTARIFRIQSDSSSLLATLFLSATVN